MTGDAASAKNPQKPPNTLHIHVKNIIKNSTVCMKSWSNSSNCATASVFSRWLIHNICTTSSSMLFLSQCVSSTFLHLKSILEMYHSSFVCWCLHPYSTFRSFLFYSNFPIIRFVQPANSAPILRVLVLSAYPLVHLHTMLPSVICIRIQGPAPASIIFSLS